MSARTPRARPLSVADQGDRELAVRVRTGDVRAEALLLERHRPALDDLPGADPATVGRTGRAALDAVRSGADHDLPFRAVWLALHGPGVLPLPPARDGVDAAPAEGEEWTAWSAFLALPPAWRTAVWHHAVEGEDAARLSTCVGCAPERAPALLTVAYAALGRRLGVLAPDPGELGRELADAVLGDVGAAYLRRRPKPPRLAAADPLLEEDQPTRGPVLLSGAAAIAAALTLVIGNQLVPLGTSVTQRLLDAGPALPGILVERAFEEPVVVPDPAVAAPVVGGTLLQPDPAADVPDGDRPGPDDPAPGPRDPGPQPDPGPGPGPDPAPQPDPPPQPPPAPSPPPVSVPVPGVGQVDAGTDGVRVELTPPGSDPVVIEVPLPELPEVGSLVP